ncbi:MAG TPA: c-type cytochrome [Gaiellaceae bacterium]|nr:c-type cytochrome [Gaiellaceae bacterium]
MTRALLGACAAVLAALAASGCGTVGLSEAGTGEVARGKELYVEKCGACHVLADAGTQGVVGPNLDDAFRQSRADGLGETTIQTVVRGQIAYPVVNPPTGLPGMPKDLVTGDDAHAVAAYVASVASLPTQGQPASSDDDSGTGTGGTETGGTETGGTDTGSGASGTQPEGQELFAANGCGSCHTLAAAGSSGSVGPNLDEAKPSQERAVEVITKGGGAMPAFGDSLSEDQIAALADYVSRNAGR